LLGDDSGKNLLWTTDINVELPIKMVASKVNLPNETPMTVGWMFKTMYLTKPEQVAML
jgi:hypothetical protein